MLNQDQKSLLKRLLLFTEYGARSSDLGLATRDNDRIRQSCRRAGWIICEDRGYGRRWYLQETGRRLLDATQPDDSPKEPGL